MIVLFFTLGFPCGDFEKIDTFFNLFESTLLLTKANRTENRPYMLPLAENRDSHHPPNTKPLEVPLAPLTDKTEQPVLLSYPIH